MFMNAITPRHFEEAASIGNQEIDCNIGFEFIFDRNVGTLPEKLLMKDVANTETLGSAMNKIETLFLLLKYTLAP
jgi:hypothetical protein